MLPVVNVFARLAMLFSLLLAVPALVSLWYDDGSARHFLQAALTGLALGAALWAISFRYQRELRTRDGFLLVALVWLGFTCIAALPFQYHFPAMSYTDAFFEAMSGLSTTGATVMTGLDTLPRSLNFWRHFSSWLGGMGIIVLAVAILPMLGIGGMRLYKAEMPGPIKDNKLAPRIDSTAKSLWYVYCGMTVACAVALKIAGMDWFDAVCHAFTTIALGGASTHDASVGHFDSPAIEMVMTGFMVLAALNYATHFVAWQQRSVRAYLRDSEAKAILLLLTASVLMLSFYLAIEGVYDFPTALRHVSFNLVSIATDSGFVTVDYGQWPIFAPLWILFLSCVTASSGSTGSGIKMFRTLTLARQSQREMQQLLHPNAVIPLRANGQRVPDTLVFSVLGFIFVYFMSVVLLTFVLLASGLDFLTAFSAIVACINNAGPGLGQVGPAANYQSLTDFQTWVCSLAMLLGRLEIFTLLILFTPAFWRK
ncbi:potassium transporter Trk [Crenobacter luteus]|uniref:Trk system potassium uptake protein n=2 Tax=Crenobacter luteus TaxID=1452487 RepID=A0A165G5N1_9NEIS|nr:potassium transporter Trk [Crenobacter luteus]